MLKKDLLNLIEVGEFSDEAQFELEKDSYILYGVCCSYCNNTKNLDLLRDTLLLKHEWHCTECNHSYNLGMIEHRLVDIIQKKIISFQNQDLECNKCGYVKANNTKLICDQCCGEYKCRITSESLHKTLKTFKKISDHHSFAWLSEEIEWTLKYI